MVRVVLVSCSWLWIPVGIFPCIPSVDCTARKLLTLAVAHLDGDFVSSRRALSRQVTAGRSVSVAPHTKHHVSSNVAGLQIGLRRGCSGPRGHRWLRRAVHRSGYSVLWQRTPLLLVRV
ncbi:hypothetical protein LX36DRAFT_452308 [Colletotrichum falcatum]|nr:hypothetical protein LX36DRAFT_452308 [Colletotrichum falcatum]